MQFKNVIITVMCLICYQMQGQYTDDNPLIAKIAKQLNINQGDYQSSDTKVLQNNPELSIVLIAKYINLPYTGEEEGFSCDLLLVLVNNKTETITSKFIEEDKFTSDAIRLEEVVLDMANFSVTDDIKAFGVRDKYSGSSGPNPSGSESLSLYSIKNNQISPILDNFETYNYTGETDMRCNFHGETINSVLIMQKTKTNGYYDIKVRSITTIETSRNPKKKDGDCIETER